MEFISPDGDEIEWDVCAACSNGTPAEIVTKMKVRDKMRTLFITILLTISQVFAQPDTIRVSDPNSIIICEVTRIVGDTVEHELIQFSFANLVSVDHTTAFKPGAQLNNQDALGIITDIHMMRLGWITQGRFDTHEFISDSVIVQDNKSDLVWQSSGSPDSLTREQAALYIETLNAEKYGGYSDWRMPAFSEAIYLMKTSYKGVPLNPVFDPLQSHIWTCDIDINEEKGRGWTVDLVNNLVRGKDPQRRFYARAVRGEL
jgi:serine/threonine-protein kinase